MDCRSDLAPMVSTLQWESMNTKEAIYLRGIFLACCCGDVLLCEGFSVRLRAVPLLQT